MRKKLNLKKETLTDIMQHYKSHEQFAEFFAGLSKLVIDQALEGELEHHLGYNKHQKSINSNSRNGMNSKMVTMDNVQLLINTPM